MGSREWAPEPGVSRATLRVMAWMLGWEDGALSQPKAASAMPPDELLHDYAAGYSAGSHDRGCAQMRALHELHHKQEGEVKKIRIGLDYGHGMDAPKGAKRYTFTAGPLAGQTIVEGRLNRLVATDVINILLAAGVEVLDLLRGEVIRPGDPWTPESRDVSLEQRVAVANRAELDAVLSIHTNAVGKATSGPGSTARGFAAFTSPGETAADPIAESIIEEVERATAWTGKLIRADTSDGDRDREARFYVLRKTRAPAVLVEGGFFVNAEDVLLLLDADARHDYALALVNGLVGSL